MTNTIYDMSKLIKTIKTTQEEHLCLNCKQYYTRKWCKDEENPCYFCKCFIPMRDTYTSILREHDWHFLKSGESDREIFYPEFINNLKLWANRFHVFPTKQDLKTEEEILNIKNWTREYWH